MGRPHVLIADHDERSRFALSSAIESLPVRIDTAADGEQALTYVYQQRYSLILLDLFEPGMDGMHVLTRLQESRPEIPVIVVTAHGTVEAAAKATKLGAIEFLQKPVVPEELRQLVARVLEHGKLTQCEATCYARLFEWAKRCLSQRLQDAAAEHLRKAISISPERPEAYNLLGVIHELKGEMYEALNNYRVAWDFDGTYEPSRLNLERATGPDRRTRPIVFGEIRAACRIDEERVGWNR
jgi:CheY-like chemotaxis protein